jgi:hypothetical protein
MGFYWVVITLAVIGAFFYLGARMMAGRAPARRPEGFPTNGETNLWPDRTGARTRKELGAKDTSDVNFVGDELEVKEPGRAERSERTVAEVRAMNGAVQNPTQGPVQAEAVDPADLQKRT